MKKRAWKVVSVLVAGAMLIGCSSGSSGSSETTAAPDETTAAAADAGAQETEAAAEETQAASGDVVTITFWYENAGDGRSEVYDELIRRFEEQNPNIHIEYLGLTQTEASSRYQTAIQAGETPDVGGTIDDWTAAIVQQDVCVPLDSYFEASPIKDVYNAGLLEAAKTFHPDGKIYYLPKTNNINGFWINTEMFANAGLEPPTTWDEVFSDIEALTDTDNGVYGFVIRGGGSSASEFMTLMYSYSGIESIFDENGKITVNDPKHLEFMQKIKDIYGVYTAESDITAGYKELVAAFDSGSAAIIYHNLGSYNTHLEAFGSNDKFLFVPYPTGANGNYTYDGSGTTGYVMFKSCEHPDEAWKWIEFLMSHEGNSYWNEQVGQIPINSECLEDEWVQNSPHILTALEVMNQDNAVAVTKPEYLPGYAAIISSSLEPAVQSMLSGDITPEEFLDKCATELQEEYDAYQSN